MPGDSSRAIRTRDGAVALTTARPPDDQTRDTEKNDDDQDAGERQRHARSPEDRDDDRESGHRREPPEDAEQPSKGHRSNANASRGGRVPTGPPFVSGDLQAEDPEPGDGQGGRRELEIATERGVAAKQSDERTGR